MDIKVLRIYHGPSQFSRHPAILWSMDSDTGRARTWMEAGWSAFHEKYPLAITQRPDSQADPILTATLLIAFWAKELQNAAGGLIHAAGAAVRPANGQIVGWAGFHNDRVARIALGIALTLIARHAGERVDDAALAWATEQFQVEAAARHPGRNSRAVLMGAHARALPCAQLLFHTRVWHYGWGRAGGLYLETSSNNDGSIGHRIARDKRVSCQFVKNLGFPAGSPARAPVWLPGRWRSDCWRHQDDRDW